MRMRLTRMACFVFLLSTASGASAQAVAVPFELKDNNLYIKVRVNHGDTLDFIFDTGSTGTLIDSAAAGKAGIGRENLRKVSVAGSGGAQDYVMATGQSLQLGAAGLQGINPVLADFTGLSAEVGHHIDGMIGYELLNRYVTAIDFDRAG